MLKRIGLFLLVNMAVLLTINIVLSLLGVRGYLTGSGIDYQSLMVVCLVYGMVGSFVSLLLSKFMAKRMLGLEVIDPRTASFEENFVYQAVARLAQARGIAMPEVAVYQANDPNAFATGPSRSNSLVAVSTGLLHSMDKRQVEAVLAHEVGHIANGDMVTMSLLQGVLNAFVLFFAKALSWGVANAMRSDNEERPSYAMMFGLEILLQIVFGIVASLIVAWFSRWREYRADAEAAKLAGAPAMISALTSLKRTIELAQASEEEAPLLANFKISGKKSYLSLFASHPDLDDRIARLQGR